MAHEPVQRRLSAARPARAGREPVLGDLPKIQKLVQQMDDVPEELQNLDELLSRHLLLQLLAVPVDARQLGDQAALPGDADSPPATSGRREHAVLGDITCDSDGKIDQFIDRRDVKRTLPLHPFNDEPYYLGVFLIGAYQEILGDLHNLFGDTNAVHVGLDGDGEVVLEARDQGRHRPRSARLRRVRRRGADAPDARRRRSRPSARTASSSNRRAASCGSTKTASTATPTSKTNRLTCTSTTETQRHRDAQRTNLAAPGCTRTSRFIRALPRLFSVCLCVFCVSVVDVRPYCRLKTTVTVMITSTGSPLSRVGVKTHCRTAVSAASFSTSLP